MSDVMRMGPFRGPRRTLVSTLSVGECQHRLHTQLDDAHIPFASFTRWRPLEVDSAIWRKVRQDRFWLFTQRASSQNRWYFYGHLKPEGGATVITGRYRMHTAVWGAPALFLLYGMYLIGGGLTGTQVFLIGRDSGWEYKALNDALVLGLGVPGLLVCIIALQGLLLRRKHHIEEQQLLACIKQVCDAKERP